MLSARVSVGVDLESSSVQRTLDIVICKLKHHNPRLSERLYILRIAPLMPRSHMSDQRSRRCSDSVEAAEAAASPRVRAIRTATIPVMSLQWQPCANDRGPKLIVARADLTTARVGAIVNCAGKTLAHGSGVSAAIVKKGGDEIVNDCRDWLKQHASLEEGQVMTTRAGKLPCTHVIHVNGPSMRVGGCWALRVSIQNALLEADRLQLTSIALPGVSCGGCGFPKELATEEIVDECVSYAREYETTTLKSILLLDTDVATYDGFVKALRMAAASSDRNETLEQVPEVPYVDQDPDGRLSRLISGLNVASIILPATVFELLSSDDPDYKSTLAELSAGLADKVVSIRRVRVSARHKAYSRLHEQLERDRTVEIKETRDLYHGTPDRWRATAIALNGFDLSIRLVGRSFGDGVYTSTDTKVALNYTKGKGSLVKLRGLVVSDCTTASHNTVIRGHIHVFPNPTALLPMLIVDFAAGDEKDRALMHQH